jgi:hypothetical protein
MGRTLWDDLQSFDELASITSPTPSGRREWAACSSILVGRLQDVVRFQEKGSDGAAATRFCNRVASHPRF